MRTLLELFADELCSLADTVATPTDNFPEIATQNCKSPCIHLNSNAKNSCFDSLIITYTCIGSVAYQQVKLLGYNLLEDGNKDIVRRMKPCPKAYKKYVSLHMTVLTLAVLHCSMCIRWLLKFNTLEHAVSIHTQCCFTVTDWRIWMEQFPS